MTRRGVLPLIIVALLLGLALPAGAINEASFLREAAKALDTGDSDRYRQLTSMLIDNPEVPEAVQRAIDDQDEELLLVGAEVLELSDGELYQRAVDVLELEQSTVPSPQGPDIAQGPPIEQDFGNADARQVDIEGLIVLELLDIRELPVPDIAREVLGLMPRPGSGERGPRPVTFESARRELQELVPAATPSAWSRWALVVTGIAAMGLLGAVWTRSRRITALATLASTDGLTGLNNRRQLDLDLDKQTEQGTEPTALLMIDIDHFTQFNFEHGHAVGDEALRQVAHMIATNAREGDVTYRYGGEEFCVLLPRTDEATATRVGNRIREAIETVSVNGSQLTASIGVASGHAANVTQTTVKADKALYAAKESGRNRVATATRIGV